MAEEVVDYVISEYDLEKKKCGTKKLKLVGSENFTKELKVDSLDEETSKYLIHMYGDKANEVTKCVSKIEKLHPKYSYINAEVIYTIREEFVKKPIDFLVRRSNIALIDIEVAKEMLDKVLNIMQNELNWNDKKVQDERKATLLILNNSL